MQSKISEIHAGRRIEAVELIGRIAVDLGTPLGWWGLAHTDYTIAPETRQTLNAVHSGLPTRHLAEAAADLAAAHHLVDPHQCAAGRQRSCNSPV